MYRLIRRQIEPALPAVHVHDCSMSQRLPAHIRTRARTFTLHQKQVAQGPRGVPYVSTISGQERVRCHVHRIVMVLAQVPLAERTSKATHERWRKELNRSRKGFSRRFIEHLPRDPRQVQFVFR